MYIFSNNRKFIKRVESSTSSGSVCVNDIAAQFINHNLPFGGVMGSGIGRYHGFSGFKEFSNIRTITYQSKINFLNFEMSFGFLGFEGFGLNANPRHKL